MVLPNWWLGIFSMFSGAFFYEKFIYQLYNIVFTSIPIMWYALYDYEFDKEILLKNPRKYQIGLKKECFGTKVFWFWLGYGAIQALSILFFCFYSIELNESSFFKSGGVVLGAVVLIVNFQIVMQSNIFDWIGSLLLFLSVILYFFSLYLFNLHAYDSDDLLGTFKYAMGDPFTYLGLLMIVAIVFCCDKLRAHISWVMSDQKSNSRGSLAGTPSTNGTTGYTKMLNKINGSSDDEG
jgi:phospholipid-transporting ATPase